MHISSKKESPGSVDFSDVQIYSINSQASDL